MGEVDDGEPGHIRAKPFYTSFSFQHLKRKAPFCVEISDFSEDNTNDRTVCTFTPVSAWAADGKLP